jgi:hypothetical protein
MNSRVSHHLHINKILVTEQHGFRKEMCSENATLTCQPKMCIGGIFCDLAKVFDYINQAS